MPNHTRFMLGSISLFLIMGVAHAQTTFLVTSISDDGAGSLRQAIVDANATVGADRIEFNIVEGDCSPEGICTIPVLTDLPAVNEAVTIDGTTQPRYGSAPANVCAGSDVPSYMRIALNGSADVKILTLEGSTASVVRGLSIGGGSQAIRMQPNSNPAAHWVHCNHLGVDAAGTAASPVSSITVEFNGITVNSDAVLGTNGDGFKDISERNVIAGSNWGVYHNSGWGFTVAGNYFGLGANGTTPIGTNSCLFFRQSAANSTYGTNLDGVSDDIERNILGDCSWGIADDTTNNTGNNLIAGNWIGLDVHGGKIGGTYGITFEDAVGTTQMVGNRIEGMTSAAIYIIRTANIEAGSVDNCITNNAKGVDHIGTTTPVGLSNNWWGDASGPSGVGPGTGDPISNTVADSVDYTPWLAEEPASCRLPELIFADGLEGTSIN